MQIKTGIDILQMKRFARVYQKHGEKFLKRFLLAEEIAAANGRVESLAGFFAAKEAFSKALGSGIGQQGVRWHDLQIQKDESGKPVLSLMGGAAAKYRELGGRCFDISISHEKKYVAAVCVLLLDD